MKTFNVKVMTFVPVENEKDIRQSSYMTVKTSVSFDEAKKVRRQYGKHAYILPYVPKLEIEQPKRVVVGKNKKSYMHHSKSNKKVVLS